MILIGGIAGGFFLASVAIAAWYLRHRHVERDLGGGRFSTVALAVSGVAILLLGIYSTLSSAGIVTFG